ncbi:GNAT family N-acetyltransferase [Saliphagus sp. GCM10025334]
MSVRISVLNPADRESWNEYVERSPQGSVFHRYDALRTQAAYSDARLYPLVGYKGEEPIGIFPIFESHTGPVTFAFSPPHGLHVPALGPALLNMNQLKQRKREKRHSRFIDGCFEWIDRELEPTYTSIRTSWRYDDMRPFKWNGFDVHPSYTYVVDLETDEETLIRRFSRTTRRTIRNHLDDEYTVTVGGVDAARWIMEQVVSRFEEQGKTATMSPSFVVELYERLPEGVVNPYVLSVDGDPVTGTILLVDGETAHRWQGGTKPGTSLPANELLEWRMLTDAMERGVSEYEIVDANIPRINEWKSKYNPNVRTYYTMQRTGQGMAAAVQLYLRLRDRNGLVTKLAPG